MDEQNSNLQPVSNTDGATTPANAAPLPNKEVKAVVNTPNSTVEVPLEYSIDDDLEISSAKATATGGQEDRARQRYEEFQGLTQGEKEELVRQRYEEDLAAAQAAQSAEQQQSQGDQTPKMTDNENEASKPVDSANNEPNKSPVIEDGKKPPVIGKEGADGANKSQAPVSNPEQARAKQLAGDVKSGKSKLQQGLNAATSAKDLKENGKERLKEQAEDMAKREAKQLAKQAAKATAQAAKKVAVQIGRSIASLFVDPVTAPFAWGAVGIILLVIIVISIIFSLNSLGGDTGKGPMIAPSTTNQKLATYELRSLVGNTAATTQYVQQVVDVTVKRLENTKNNIGSVYKDKSKAEEVQKELDALIIDVKVITSITDVKERTTKINELTAKLSAFNNKYPEIAGSMAANGGYLPVPGVLQAAGGDCGAASILMVSLYYDSKYKDDELYDSQRKASRKEICVSPSYINNHTPYKDWNYVKYSSNNLNAVKKSLAGGDPVVMYLGPGGIYSGGKFGGKHITVIVGFDPSDNTFLINNPSTKKVDLHTKTPNGKQMTAERIAEYNGDAEYGHTFIIRGKYLK